MLDIGCGRGEALKYAIEHGAEEVVGIDFSEDAVAITRDYLKQFNLAGTIYCADATEQVQQWSASTPTPVFDIVIMFDCVEHIPRKELSVLLTFLHKLLCPCGIVAVNTPVYSVDNDVLAEGLKFAARDPTDTFEATSGMHCNRYSLGSLKAYMNSLGYAPVSGHIFAFGMQINKNMWGSIRAIEMAAEQGYPIVLQRALLPEYYDLTGTLSYMLRENIKSALPEWAVRCVRMCLHPGQIVKFGRNSR